MILKIFTLIHVIIIPVGILSGVIVLGGLLAGKRLNSWTALLLTTTVLTSATGYVFPFHGITPAMVVGAISLAVHLGFTKEQVQGFVDVQVATIPMGRVGTPDEIAKAVVFPASDDSSFVNGIELFVDGGMAQI